MSVHHNSITPDLFYQNSNRLEFPALSIIIVTFNASKYIQQCINSIKEQSFTNYELLIFDGKSNDETLSIIQKNEPYVSYWQSEADSGIYDAMNKAVKHVRGKWILFLGADDFLLEGFSEMAKQFKDEQTLYYGKSFVNGKVSGKKYSKYHIAKINYNHQAIFYPAFVFKKYLYLTQYKVYADYVLNIQCWGDDTITKKFLPFVVSNYSEGGFSAHNHASDLFKKDKPQWIKKNLGILVYLKYSYRRWKAKIKGQTDFF